MREILFRGKRVDNGEWIYGGWFSVDHENYIIINCDNVPVFDLWNFAEEVIPETLGQFTGLTDKNGKKIFEGDIVAYNTLYIDGKEYQEIGYFECDEKYVNFKIHGTQMTPFRCEVIGNIHDNPELLGENK